MVDFQALWGYGFHRSGHRPPQRRLKPQRQQTEDVTCSAPLFVPKRPQFVSTRSVLNLIFFHHKAGFFRHRLDLIAYVHSAGPRVGGLSFFGYSVSGHHQATTRPPPNHCGMCIYTKLGASRRFFGKPWVQFWGEREPSSTHLRGACGGEGRSRPIFVGRPPSAHSRAVFISSCLTEKCSVLGHAFWAQGPANFSYRTWI